MLKKEYYCLIAGLPDLFLSGNNLEFNGIQFRYDLQQQLSASDYKLLEYLFLPFDNKNLLNILFQKEERFNTYGTITHKELDFQLSSENENLELTTYMLDFLVWVEKKEIKEWSLEAENKLYEYFYEYALCVNNDFFRGWFTFELNIKNVLTAFNCERFNYHRSQHIIPSSQIKSAYNLIHTKVLRPEIFEDEIPFCDQIFKVAASDQSWIQKEKSIDKLKWNYLDEHTFFHYFTIEKVLSYCIKILITERWMKLDVNIGRSLLHKLMNELKTSYQFDEEFSLNK